MARLKKRERFRRAPEINMVSMIDVMSLLMCVTLVTAPMLSTGIDLDLPRGGRQAIAADDGLTISIDRDGAIFIGMEQVERQDLRARVGAVREANPDVSIVISGDAYGRYGVVVEVMAELRDMGLARVGLKMEPATRAR